MRSNGVRGVKICLEATVINTRFATVTAELYEMNTIPVSVFRCICQEISNSAQIS